MKALLSALPVGLALMVMGASASAVPVSYRFESSVDISSFGLPASPGDPASITVTLDNGGTSIVNQVWTAAHLQSVIFDINNGAATVSFFSPFDGGLVEDEGSFATDAFGNLISAPQNWADRIATADFVANVPTVGGLDWFINGANGVVFNNSFSAPRFQLFLPNVQGNTDPANWSRVTALSAAADAAAAARRAGWRGPAAPRESHLEQTPPLSPRP